MKVDWRKGILYVTTIGVESCWLYAVMVLLNQKLAQGLLSIFWILLIYLVSAGCNGLLRKLPWPRAVPGTISWILWVAVLLLTVKTQLFAGSLWSDTVWLLAIPRAFTEVIYAFKPELLILISTAVIWWLGRRLAYLKVNFTSMVTEFQFGLLMLVITFLVASPFGIEIADSVYLIVAFFLFSLLGISVAHAMEGTGWLSGLNRGNWSGLLIISIGLILLMGFVVSILVTPDLLRLVLTAVKWLWGLVWGLVIVGITFLASLLPQPGPGELPPMAPLTGAESSDNFTLALPDTLLRGLRLGYTFLVIGIFVIALWRISAQVVKWLRGRLANMSGAEFEPLPGALRADFLGLLKRLLSRILGLKKLWQRRAQARTVVPEIASVRQIYRQFLRWASASGFPRPVSQTPHEYLDRLAGLLPEVQGELALMTQQYVRTRYGAWLPGENDIQELRQSWHNVKQTRLSDRRHT